MVISLKNVTVKFYETCVLKNINLDINKGEYVNIIGPNGSGKTTLIKVLTNLLEPNEGVVKFGNYQFGYVPQHLNKASFMPATVLEILKNTTNNKVSDEEIDDYLKKMDIYNLKHKKMKLLSGGESQRVYIIRALLSNPDVLILDEPTSALDYSFRLDFYQLISDLHFKGMTIIHVTHDLTDGLRHGSKIVHLDHEILFNGDFEAYKKYKETEGRQSHVWNIFIWIYD